MLTIGSRIENADQPVQLRAEKFNRHTFWCGQSGSGKTYALGVLLEQLLLGTELPILVMDPNADFSRMTEMRPGADAESAQSLSDIDMRVFHSSKREGERLHTRFTDLSVPSKAAVLQLDPIADPHAYNILLHQQIRGESFDRKEWITGLRASNDPGQERLATRVENLQVLDWDLWSLGGESVTDVIETRPRATVLDLGGFSHPAEPKVAALSVLETLWTKREDRRPILIVIDEAHNLCPPDPSTAVERRLTEQLIQIAAEGRKFGLWLLLSTQRPTKIHPNVLSQCDNLALMRMNAPRDLAELADVFGFVSPEQIARSQNFSLGQAIFAGGFVDEPTLVQMGDRVTEEGGVDVLVP